VPLVVFVVVRLYRALAATFNLLTDVALLRSLPWRYIVRLPLRHGWIGIAAASLIVTLVGAVLALVLPGTSASGTALGVGWVAALVGLASSWVRAVVMWIRVRGY
jgi:hypothetical protein